MRLGTVDMDFEYADYFGEQPSTGYERLLHDCMIGDATLFQRADMVEAGWSVVSPLLDVWKASSAAEFPELCRRGVGSERCGRIDRERWTPMEEFREMILAGDIGGTNSRLAFFDVADGQLKLVTESIYPSKEARGLDEIVVKFLKAASYKADIATFGIAGPGSQRPRRNVKPAMGRRVKRLVAELKHRKRLGHQRPRSERLGHSHARRKRCRHLEPCQRHSRRKPGGHSGRHRVSAKLACSGTARQYRIFATEGGHADFAARDELEIDLLRYLHTHFGGHVSYERIVSGPGLVNVYQFLKDTGRGEEPAWLTRRNCARRAGGGHLCLLPWAAAFRWPNKPSTFGFRSTAQKPATSP